MNIRKFIIFVYCTIFSIHTYAQRIDLETAQSAAIHFMAEQQPLKKNNAQKLELSYTAQTASMQKSGDSIPCFYVFNRPEGGFVIVAAAENIVPILAYSDQGCFKTDEVPDNMQGMLQAMKEEISDAIIRRVEAAPKVKKQWEQLKLQTERGYNSQADAVDPLTQYFYWDQWPYFNDSCPYDANVSSTYGHRCPAGCTATAMAIVIRYWRYPLHGYGSHSYTHTTYGTQSADFANTYYQYELMPDYFPALPRPSQRKAVAQLLYHCGVAVNMNYSPTGSGAYVYAPWDNNANDALHALQNYFGYSGTTGVRKKDYSDYKWKQLLKEQLRKGQPVIFSGYHPEPGSGAGHAFVCDGFDKNDMFHFNWGWSGNYNCYCTIDSLCPSGVGVGGGKGNYSRDQSALININPYDEAVQLGWENADAFCMENVNETSHQLLFPDTCMRLCDDGADGYALTTLHCMGTTFNPSAPLFGSRHNRKLFQYPYRMDSLRIRYQYHIGSRQPADARPDTLRIYLSYHEIGDGSYQMVSLLQSDSTLCPITENHPVRPIAANRICIDYPLSSADTAYSQITIPTNYRKATALGFDIPEDAIMSVMLQFVPGYPYQNGDTLRITTGGKSHYLHNAFALTCLQGTHNTFSNGQYNAALWENSADDTSYSTANRYTPIPHSFPQWDYHLQYNTRPTAAYIEKDTQICGSGLIWNKLHITKDGDYMQRLTGADGRDSIVVLHLSLENSIGEMGDIQGASLIDSLGEYEFYVNPVEQAASYKWELSSPKWQLLSDSSNKSTLIVNERSSGTIRATAWGAKGICHSSSQIHLKFCDPMDSVSNEIHGLDQIYRDGVYFYYIDSVEKAVSYQWRVYHDGWSIEGDSNRTSAMVHIGNSGSDSLYLIVTDECGYTATRTLLIQSSVNIAENTDGKLSVLIWPNPAQEVVWVRLPHQGNFEVLLTDATGRCLQHKKAEMECRFDLQPYAAGTYFITVRCDTSELLICPVVKK